ncbi:MAG: alpha/beta hydrolase [Nocardiopsaceae bacterium]|nr:alpha/beta hydrolase [Nocardiopsaceae bacterium]
MSTALPRDVIDQLASFGPDITPDLREGSWALLTPFHEKAGYTAPRVERDLAYGPHERHRLDVHAGIGTSDPSPVVLFAHGGGFVAGDKHVPGTPMYDHVGAWAVRHGWTGVTMTYRLAPGHTWPAGAEDVAAAVAWTREHIAAYGGDPDRIVVAGHSAGAVHVASFIAGQGGGSTAGVRGATLLSGVYDLSGPGETPGRGETPDRGELEKAYFGDLPGQTVSSLPWLLDTEIPLLFSVAEHDPALFHAQAAGVVAAWLARHGTVPALAYAQGHNHISEIASLGIDDDALGIALARFIARHTS